MTVDRKIEIANTIIKQLGGIGKLYTMVDANRFVALDSGLQFSFKGSRKINKLVVKLDPSDTYTVEFWKIYSLKTGKSPKLIGSHSDIYFDMLVELFENETGLSLRL